MNEKQNLIYEKKIRLKSCFQSFFLIQSKPLPTGIQKMFSILIDGIALVKTFNEN